MITILTESNNYDTKIIARYLKNIFDDEAFGTAYTTHRISKDDAYMARNGLYYDRNNQIIYDKDDNAIFRVVPQYGSKKVQGTYAPKTPILKPIDEVEGTRFYYNGKLLGICKPYYMECGSLYSLLKNDKEAATSVLNYLNSLGDPVFPVSDEDWGTAETNIDNVNIQELYNTFMQELNNEYEEQGDDLNVVFDGFEIFIQ